MTLDVVRRYVRDFDRFERVCWPHVDRRVCRFRLCCDGGVSYAECEWDAC